MKISKKMTIATTAVTLIPCLIGLALWNRLPGQVPTHWNFKNQIDGYSSKAMLVFGIPAFMAAMQLFLLFMCQNDPKGQNIGRRLFHLIAWILPVISVVLTSISYGIAMGFSINVGKILNIMLGLLFIGVGNYLPKSKQSYTTGLKMPWTLSSEENWNRTHRLAGRLWMLGGALFIVNAFWPSQWLFFLVLILISGIPGAYSYWLYRKGI